MRRDLRQSLTQALTSIATNVENHTKQKGLIERAVHYLKSLVTSDDRRTAKSAMSSLVNVADGNHYGIQGGATSDENEFIPALKQIVKPAFAEAAQANPKDAISAVMQETWRGVNNTDLGALVEIGMKSNPTATLRAIDANLEKYDRDYSEPNRSELETLTVVANALRSSGVGSEHSKAVLSEIDSLINEKNEQLADLKSPLTSSTPIVQNQPLTAQAA